MNTPGATPTQWMTPAEQYSATREHLQAFNKKYLGLTDYAQTSALLGKTFYTLLIQSRDNILREWLWMAMLPTPARLLWGTFGRPDASHLFTQEASFET